MSPTSEHDAVWRTIAERPERDRAQRFAPLLAELGLTQPSLSLAFARLSSSTEFPSAASRVARSLRSAASPERALHALEDAASTLIELRGDASPLFVDVVLQPFLLLAGSSVSAARRMARDPGLAIELGARAESLLSQTDFTADIEQLVAAGAGDTERFDRMLRRFRHRRMLSIALREIRGADLRETSKEIADLAAASLEASLRHHRPLLEARVGALSPDCASVVMGMGKLGGRELNFSSDVDLIFFYEHDESTAGELTAHQFHVKLFERVIASMARVTEHGFVFRVDMNLRPEGKRGPLANSLASAERYYETWGRTWERAAWIRSRPVAGDPKLGAAVLEMMRPFVWRRSFDLKAIEEIIGMKEKIDEARRLAALSALGGGLDLKLGDGGIREVEFFVQAQQLLHGGRDPMLRAPNTLEALAALEAKGHVSARTRQSLTNAYLLFRRVEHRVQIVDDQQTHHLPESDDEQSVLARSLGLASASALRALLESAMHEVHEQFQGLMGVATDDEPTPTEVDLLLSREVEGAELEALWSRLGFLDPGAAQASLDSAARFAASPFHPRAPAEARRLARRTLFECARSPSPDRALRHLPDLLRAGSLHRANLDELARPDSLRGVVRVLGASDLLARILVSSPALLAHVLLPKSLPPLSQLAAEAKARVSAVEGDVEEAMAVLRAVKQEETLRTALFDLAGLIDGPAVGDRLSRLAELLIHEALELALSQMEERYGRPQAADGSEAEVCLVGGGTLGAREMSYRTDVDLSVIYEGVGETTGGSRGRVGVAEFYTRTVQRLLQILTLRTAQGDLYPVDMRLRPSGTQGPLVASLSSFQSYHEKTAQLWERQALVRSRTVAGSERLREVVDAAIEAATYGTPAPSDAAVLIRDMRERLAKENLRGLSAETAIDLKHGTGGLVELDFLTQYLLLEHGHRHAEVRSTSTRVALERLGAAGLLAKDVAERLVVAQERLRRVQNWLRVTHDEMLDRLLLQHEPGLTVLARTVGYSGEDAGARLVQEVREDMAFVHRVWLGVLGES